MKAYYYGNVWILLWPAVTRIRNKIKFHNNFYCCFAAWTWITQINLLAIMFTWFSVFVWMVTCTQVIALFTVYVLYCTLAWSRMDGMFLTINHVNLNIVWLLEIRMEEIIIYLMTLYVDVVIADRLYDFEFVDFIYCCCSSSIVHHENKIWKKKTKTKSICARSAHNDKQILQFFFFPCLIRWFRFNENQMVLLFAKHQLSRWNERTTEDENKTAERNNKVIESLKINIFILFISSLHSQIGPNYVRNR